MTGFKRLFVANRGEAAVRIARACDELGITPVLAVSSADRDAPYTRGRETVCIGGPRPGDSYLRLERIVQAARQSGCSALHPAWGFLAEDPRLSALCSDHGLSFVGPPPEVMELMGRKTPAKRAMRAAGLRLIPGSDGVVADAAEARAVAEGIGYPVLLKAESGGGGRGMRIVRRPDELDNAYAEAQAEALAAFGDGRLYVERLVERARHVEIQLLGDRYGRVIHLGERDCTVQRHHQKLVEESPAPGLDARERERTLAAAVAAAAAIGYVGAGTMEFLLDDQGELRFMEMNTRLQVEHPVSEMRTGIDLVKEQIRIAAGHPLGREQREVSFSGHAIECRIDAEDPRAGFRPTPGLVSRWEAPHGDPDLRADTHVESGYRVPPYYDSLLCKLIARGADRDAACDKLVTGLDALVCEGVPTTAEVARAIVRSPAFRAGSYHTDAIPGWPPASPPS
jgi:acetyl-CoA carboxylase biotin carboxylase subunit